MENKKLLKFLLKDINEIEELFAEKGNSGFDSFEIDFITGRFEGAKKIIHILEDQQENSPLEEVAEIPEVKQEETQADIQEETEVKEEVVPEVIAQTEVEEKEETPIAEESVKEDEVIDESFPEPEVEQVPEEEIVKETVQVVEEKEPEEEPVEVQEAASENGEPKRLGDSFLKEKSLNDSMAGGSNKLENKLSNTPVSSLQRAIGINDRYIYIRELFEGDADKFSSAVGELDRLQNIEEAVSYLQQNYKWKKNETSLKFVNLVKRRFPNG